MELSAVQGHKLIKPEDLHALLSNFNNGSGNLYPAVQMFV